MNVNTEYHFNRNQLLALGTVMLLSPALRLFPSASAALAGRGAWLSPLMAVPFLLAYICFISRLMNARREGEGLAELGLRCFGKKAGKIILAIMLLWLLLYSGFVLRSGADRLITTIYPYSSPPFFIIIMGLICMIAALGSARAIVRMAKLIQPVVLGVLLLVLVFALFSADFTNLLPLTVYDALPVMKGALPAINVIVVIVYLVCFLGGLKPNEPHRFRQYSVWMLLMSLLLTALSVAVVGSFGAELTARLTRPFFSLVRNLIFFRSIERMESLVVALWIFPDFLLVSLLFYSAQHCLRLILGVKKPDYNGERFFDMSGKRWVIPLCAAVSVSCGALMAPDPIILDLWSEKLIPLINYIFAFIFIPIIYIVGKIKKAL